MEDTNVPVTINNSLILGVAIKSLIQYHSLCRVGSEKNGGAFILT